MADITEEKRVYDKKYRQDNLEKISKKSKEYYESVRSKSFREKPAEYLYKVAKARAKQKQIEFTIDITDIVIPLYCPITKAELIKTNGYSPHSMSVDRVDNTKGYVKGNVRVISRWANLKKSSLGEADLVTLLAYVRGEL